MTTSRASDVGTWRPLLDQQNQCRPDAAAPQNRHFRHKFDTVNQEKTIKGCFYRQYLDRGFVDPKKLTSVIVADARTAKAALRICPTPTNLASSFELC
jgi:hypothetical protein